MKLHFRSEISLKNNCPATLAALKHVQQTQSRKWPFWQQRFRRRSGASAKEMEYGSRETRERRPYQSG